MHDKNPRNVSMQEIFCKVALEIAERWSTSNSELKEPIVCGPKATELRLSRGWSTFSEIARGKARKATKEQWEPKRDNLLDIAFCTCRIVLCGEDDAPGTFRKRTVKENLMTMTEEPRGRYLTHFTPEPKTRKAKLAKQCAIGLVDWLKDRGIDLSPKLIGSDTTKCLAGKVVYFDVLKNSSIKDFLGLSVGFTSMTCHSVILWQSLMDQPLQIKDGVVQLVNSFPKLRLWKERPNLSQFRV